MSGHATGSLGWGRAAGHLERQLAEIPDRSGGATPRTPRHRRPGPSGDQGARGPAAADGAAVDGLRPRLQRHQPVERRRDPQPGRASRTSRSASTTCPAGATRSRQRRGRSARPAAGCGCGRCTSPTAARSTTRTTSTSSTGWPGSREAAHGWLGDDVCLVGDWNIAPRDEDVFDMAAYANGHARDATRAGGVPGVPRRRLGRRRAPAHAGTGRLHLLGLLPAAVRAEPRHAHRLRRSARRRSQSRVTHAFIDRDERAGKGASDHAPVIVDLVG